MIKLEDRLALGSEAFVHDPDRDPDVDGIAEWIWNDRIGEDWVDFIKGLFLDLKTIEPIIAYSLESIVWTIAYREPTWRCLIWLFQNNPFAKDMSETRVCASLGQGVKCKLRISVIPLQTLVQTSHWYHLIDIGLNWVVLAQSY